MCPSSGFYYFSVSTLAAGSPSAALELLIEGTRVATAFAWNGGTQAASNSAVVQCGSGDKVYVQCNDMHGCVQYGTNNSWGNTVTFSGFMLGGDD